MNSGLIGFEALSLKAGGLTVDVKSANESAMSESTEKLDSPKSKPVPAEKPSPSTLERRKLPVAAPRSIVNAAPNQQGLLLRLFSFQYKFGLNVNCTALELIKVLSLQIEINNFKRLIC